PLSISSNTFTPFSPRPVPTPTTAAPTVLIRAYPAASRTPPTPMMRICPSASACSSSIRRSVATFPSEREWSGAPASPPTPWPGRAQRLISPALGNGDENARHDPSVLVAVRKLTGHTPSEALVVAEYTRVSIRVWYSVEWVYGGVLRPNGSRGRSGLAAT